MLKKPLQTKTQITVLLILTYLVSYLTRVNFGAIISELETATGFLRSTLSMAVTGNFIAYGVGQIISGILGNRFSPKKLVSAGLIITTCMNFLIPLCINPTVWGIVWCINGFAQSLMWPPLVRLMTTMFNDEEYKSVSSKVLFGGSVGTIVIYLISPVLIFLFSWKAVFLFSAICGVLMLISWNAMLPEVTYAAKEQTKTRSSKNGGMRAVFDLMFFTIMVAIVLQGSLRDGVTTWMPSYIADTYHLSSVVSILTGVFLPLFGMICIQVASVLYVKRFKNPLQCSMVFFAGAAAMALLLYCFTGRSAIISVVSSALLTGCMHGVHLILICMIPPFFKKNGNVSTVSGVLNACTYVGSAISTYGIALLSEKMGWHGTLLVWFCAALLGTLLCAVCVKPWSRKMESGKQRE